MKNTFYLLGLLLFMSSCVAVPTTYTNAPEPGQTSFQKYDNPPEPGQEELKNETKTPEPGQEELKYE